ncbi:molybdate transport system ATP-binding protein [termite gut metagenome]|uniref:Molybdate transport system ATP-binding protein n=1 Tax=termite gut metagenome TaxID=433724 RepID=A0A5J4T2X4_9ZZZZ
MQNIIEIKSGIVRNPFVHFNAPINLIVASGEHLAIVGPNGAGKSLLIDTLTGKYVLKEGKILYDFSPSPAGGVYNNMKYIAFRDSYGDADANYYYQQRWNTYDQDDIPVVRELLGETEDKELRQELFDIFRIESLLDKKIIHLSGGELRKLQLTKTLLSAPRVLIIDNPFIGLDTATRTSLNELLQRLANMPHLQIILVLSAFYDIPSFITHVVPVEGLKVGEKLARKEYLLTHRFNNFIKLSSEEIRQHIVNLPYSNTNYISEEIIRLNKVSIRYGNRTILKELNWVVQRGEKWAIGGENGTGKSTLLSLVCADNPQSYACDISLFGRKRGTGESIWEIKKHIGYVSPEMHRAYMKNLPAIEIVASGLHDSIGLYKYSKPEHLSVCEWWMDIFGIADLKDKPFLQLSSGEQRLTLLARAFVKDPALLILDEPLHGLDTFNRMRVKEIITAFCQRQNKTMIMVTHYEEELPDCITNKLFLRLNR